MSQSLQVGSINSLDRANAEVHEHEARLTFIDLWKVLLKRRLVVATVAVVTIVSTALYSWHIKPTYQSSARLEIDQPSSTAVGIQNVIAETGGMAGSTLLPTQIRILESDSVLFETAQRYRDLHSGSQAPIPAKHAQLGQLSVGEQEYLINSVRGGLAIQIIPQTQILELSYRSTDPRYAADILNTLMDTYIQMDLQTKFDRTTHVSGWLQSQLQDLQVEATDAQRKLADFQRQNNIVGADASSNLITQDLQAIGQQLISAQVNRILKEARLRQLESDPNPLALLPDNPSIGVLHQHLTDLEAQRADLSTKLGAEHPKMKQLDAEEADAKQSIQRELASATNAVREQYQNALNSEQLIQKRLDTQKDEAYRLNEVAAQYAILRHESEATRELYDTLQVRLKEAGVTAGLGATNITVVDRASIHLIPIAPKKTYNLFLGGIGGLFAGILLAFVVDSLDDTLPTSEDVERVSGLPSLGAIPHILPDGVGGGPKRKEVEVEAQPSLLDIRGIVTLQAPKSRGAEAYRSLRSSLLLSSIDRSPRVITVTSAFPGEGKSTTAANLSIALAQRGAKVLLVDCDLRRGSLGRLFSVRDPEAGLTHTLAYPEKATPPPAPFEGFPNLHVVPVGPRPPNPAEVLSSNRMRDQIGIWREEYDHIVLDTAPLLVVSDSQALAVLSDVVVLVVRAGVTRKRALLRSSVMLQRINTSMVGIVVNDVDLRLENFYTYRYGSYTYGYSRYHRGGAYGGAYGYEDKEGEK